MALLVVAFLFLEVVAFFAGLYLQDKGVYYAPPEELHYQEYMAQRDPVLGWPSPASFGRDGGRGASGARVDPLFADSLSPCVSVYGDSYTWSQEVDDASAWSSVLGHTLGCRVANYGVGGYGSDQAYLRYLQNEDDDAPVVVLNHMSGNILRNVSQYWDLLYPAQGKGLKPRFLVDERGELEWLPLPRYTETEYEALVKTPENYLDHDYFVPGGESGVTRLRFPYLVSVLRAFGHYHVQSALAHRPRHEPFYDPEHEAGGLGVTVAILSAFAEHAAKNGRHPVVTVLPTGDDLIAFQAKQRWPYQPLLDSLEARGVSVLNVGAGMATRLDGADPCSLFDDCSAHYNERGYAVVASLMYEHLESLERAPPNELDPDPVARTLS